MRILFLLLLCTFTALGQNTYTEFYCDSAVSANNTNVNAGSTTGGPVYGPSVNGNWDGTSIFTPVDGSTPANTVSAGMWASVYLDAATAATYIALVTNVAAGVNGAITLSQANYMGSKPASGATGRSIRVGGCWKGPFGSVIFPIGFVANTATNLNRNIPRVNLKSSATYSITAAGTHGNAGPIVFQGYGSSPGDGTKATIDGGTSSINLFNSSSVNFITLADLIFNHNSAAGGADGVRIGGSSLVVNCVFLNFSRCGVNSSSSGNAIVECEAIACNGSDSSSYASFLDVGNCSYNRCIARGNTTGANGNGFRLGNASIVRNCISANNRGSGFQFVGSSGSLINCIAYSNALAGVDYVIATAGSYYVENCNFVQNQTYGIDSSGSAVRSGYILNSGFGSGAFANVTSSLGPNITGNNQGCWITNNWVDIASAPWQDPTNGDFRIILPSLKAAGRGSFTESQVGYTGTIGYPDIGPAQGASTNAAGGGSYTFAQ